MCFFFRNVFYLLDHSLDGFSYDVYYRSVAKGAYHIATKARYTGEKTVNYEPETRSNIGPYEVSLGQMR